MQGLELLPQERRAYYQRLHERLVEIVYQGVKNGDWQSVQDASKHHMDLQRICFFEAKPPLPGGRWECFDIILDLIENFCRGCGFVKSL